MLGFLLCIQIPASAPPVHLWVERAESGVGHRPFRPCFGAFVGAVGDVDGDGTPDLLVADVLPQRETDPRDLPPSDGCVWIFSGRDGRTLARVAEPDPRERGGFSCAALGDIDGDGCSDWAVSWGRSHAYGVLDVRSGKTSTRLLAIEGPGDFARILGNAGDVDGDGHDDLIASGGPESIAEEDKLPLATILSSRDGKVLSRIEATETFEMLVAPPIAVGNQITGEGACEMLLTASFDQPRACLRMIRARDAKALRSILLPQSSRSEAPDAARFRLDRWTIHGEADEPACLVSHADGMVWAVSSRTGLATILRHQDRELWIEDVGMAVAGRIDEDSSPDYWIGTYGSSAGDPVMLAISGADGHTIYGCGRTDADLCDLDVDPRACCIAAVGDVDGDGLGDALFGTSHVYGGQQGAAFLVSGKSGKIVFGWMRKGAGVSVIRP